MKYILKKKWHPSQVEEVGYEFEATPYIRYKPSKYDGLFIEVLPHEIALLVDAGYLVKQTEKCLCHLTRNSIHEPSCPLYPSELEKAEPTIDLWTTEPPELTVYWCVILNFKEDDPYRIFKRFFQKNSAHSYFDLETNNCHRTQKSAEEALKRLLS